MFKKIMVPVDLAHADMLKRALDVAASLGAEYGATVTYVGVTAGTPGPTAHNPTEYLGRLESFAADQGTTHGHKTAAKAEISHDPSVDLDATLLRAADEIGADLIVIASHIPTLADHLWPSHGGQIARRAKASVFVVRSTDIQEGK